MFLLELLTQAFLVLALHKYSEPTMMTISKKALQSLGDAVPT